MFLNVSVECVETWSTYITNINLAGHGRGGGGHSPIFRLFGVGEGVFNLQRNVP